MSVMRSQWYTCLVFLVEINIDHLLVCHVSVCLSTIHRHAHVPHVDPSTSLSSSLHTAFLYVSTASAYKNLIVNAMPPYIRSHLPTHRNPDIVHRLISPPSRRPNVFNLSHYIHAILIRHLPKHNVLIIQERSFRTRDEELTSIRIRSGVCHGQQSRRRVFPVKVLVGKGCVVVDRCRACTVAVEEITSLDHESSDLRRRFFLLVKLRFRMRSERIVDLPLGGICYLCNPRSCR